PDVVTEGPVHEEEITRRTGGGPAMVVALGSTDHLLGTLVVANPPESPPFSDEDREVIRLFAAQAAVALEHPRIRGQLERLAVLEDRERIARDLHDGVIQALFALGMTLQAAGSLDDLAAMKARIHSAVDDIDASIGDIRRYIFE